MRHCLSSPGLEWSISKSQWKPSQGCARGSGLASILAPGLVRGDPQIYRAAHLEKLWHLACVSHSQTTFYPREGRLKGDPLVQESAQSQAGGQLPACFRVTCEVMFWTSGASVQPHLCPESLEV